MPADMQFLLVAANFAMLECFAVCTSVMLWSVRWLYAQHVNTSPLPPTAAVGGGGEGEGVLIGNY